MDNMREDMGHQEQLMDLSSDLLKLGYSEAEITSAYSWMMDHIRGAERTLFRKLPTSATAQRLLSPAERYRFTSGAYGYLLELVHSHQLSFSQFELLVDQANQLPSWPVTSEQLQLLAAAVMFADTTGGPETLGDIDGYAFLSIH
jgi:uncharacterized protein Smg (DUF494 family)